MWREKFSNAIPRLQNLIKMILGAYYESLGSEPQTFFRFYEESGDETPQKKFGILGVFPLIFYQKID